MAARQGVGVTRGNDHAILAAIDQAAESLHITRDARHRVTERLNEGAARRWRRRRADSKASRTLQNPGAYVRPIMTVTRSAIRRR